MGGRGVGGGVTQMGQAFSFSTKGIAKGERGGEMRTKTAPKPVYIAPACCT